MPSDAALRPTGKLIDEVVTYRFKNLSCTVKERHPSIRDYLTFKSRRMKRILHECVLKFAPFGEKTN